MRLPDRLTADLKDAMRARDEVRLSAIRGLRTAITEREKSGQDAPDDDALTAIVAKQAKQRRDSIAQFEAAGRDDLAGRERAELKILETYLPAQATDDEIEATVARIVAETGAASMKDLGRVMGPSMAALRGQADGSRVQAAVRAALGG